MTLEQLENLIAQRSSAPSGESWTAQLLEKGPEKCAEKFGEEAIELIIEAVKNDSEGLSHVMAELERRTAQSGLTEKAARKT
jgi:phosphoribosyl-ATP pyrophosphohydrolase